MTPRSEAAFEKEARDLLRNLWLAFLEVRLDGSVGVAYREREDRVIAAFKACLAEYTAPEAD